MKLLKEDKSFLWASFFYMLVVFFRFFDFFLRGHQMPFVFLWSYLIIFVVTILFGFAWIFFVGFVLSKCGEEEKASLRYLLVMLMTALYGTFICDSYYGSTDVYAWLIFMFCFSLLLMKKAEWLVIPAAFVAMYFSPMSAVTVGMLLMVMLFVPAVEKEWNLRYITMLALTGLAELLALYLNRKMGVFSTDAQGRLSFYQLCWLIVFFSPYVYIITRFFLRLIREVRLRQHVIYALTFLGGVPVSLLWIYYHDYNRAIVCTFAYYFLLIIFYLLRGDQNFKDYWMISVVRVKQKLPVPEVVVIYFMLILTMWMIGAEDIDTEKILTLVQ